MMTATMSTFWLLALVTGRPVAPLLIPADAWPGLLGVCVLATFVAIVTFYVGASRVGAAQAALIATLEPVWTIALAAAPGIEAARAAGMAVAFFAGGGHLASGRGGGFDTDPPALAFQTWAALARAHPVLGGRPPKGPDPGQP